MDEKKPQTIEELLNSVSTQANCIRCQTYGFKLGLVAGFALSMTICCFALLLRWILH